MRRAVAFGAAGLLLMLLVAPVSAGRASTWHRLNSDGDGEHERLMCAAGNPWSCIYDKLPEPSLGLHWDNTTGKFMGNGQETWCPDEWAAEICQHVVGTVVGATSYSPGFTWWENLVFTDGDGVAPLYMYVVGPYWEGMCPWYSTWADALANDSACIFAS